MIDHILHPTKVTSLTSAFLGFTLTRAEPKGMSLGDREALVHRHIATLAREAGFTTSRVSGANGGGTK